MGYVAIRIIILISLSSLYYNKNTGPGCLPGWERHQQSCYYVNGETKKTYSEARAACKTTGGTLTSVLDEYEQKFLISESEQLDNEARMTI